jgi:hypothetical protein
MAPESVSSAPPRIAGIPSALLKERAYIARVEHESQQRQQNEPPQRYRTEQPMPDNGSPHNANPMSPGQPSPYGNHYAKQKRTELYKSQVGEPGLERQFMTETREMQAAKKTDSKPQPVYGHQDFYAHKFNIGESKVFYGTPTSRDNHSPDRAHRVRQESLEQRRNDQIDEATRSNPRRLLDSNWSITPEKQTNARFSHSSHNQSTHTPVAAARAAVRQSTPHSAGHARFQSSGFSLAHDSPAGNVHYRTSNGVTGSATRSQNIYD